MDWTCHFPNFCRNFIPGFIKKFLHIFGYQKLVWNNHNFFRQIWKQKIWLLKQRFFFFWFLKKNRVRWNFNTVFGFKKTVLDRIPGYKRMVLKEECLYNSIPKIGQNIKILSKLYSRLPINPCNLIFFSNSSLHQIKNLHNSF